jgi:hypothetical protein
LELIRIKAGSKEENRQSMKYRDGDRGKRNQERKELRIDYE